MEKKTEYTIIINIPSFFENSFVKIIHCLKNPKIKWRFYNYDYFTNNNYLIFNFNKNTKEIKCENFNQMPNEITNKHINVANQLRNKIANNIPNNEKNDIIIPREYDLICNYNEKICLANDFYECLNYKSNNPSDKRIERNNAYQINVKFYYDKY